MSLVGGAERGERRKRRDAVSGDDGQQHPTHRARREQLGDSGQGRIVMADYTSQQRAPRKMDGQPARQAVEGLRRVLDGRNDEERVAKLAA